MKRLLAWLQEYSPWIVMGTLFAALVALLGWALWSFAVR